MTGATTPALTAYTVGQQFAFLPVNTNTGAATLNISSVGAGAVQKNGGALTGGELRVGVPTHVYVSTATPVFEIVSGAPTYTTFTPTVTLVGGGGNTVPVYTTNTGRYARDGNVVHVDVYLTGDGGNEGAGTGTLTIALPATANAANPTESFPCGFAINNATNYLIFGSIAAGGTTVGLNYLASATSIVAFTGADQNNATRSVRLKFTYEASP